MATTIINIKEASVFFADTQVALDTAPDFTCQITSAAINANPSLQTVPATFCGPESQVPSATGWELVLAYLQDWGVTPLGISQYLFDHDASRSWFRVVPTDPTAPGAEGECWLVAGSYLGDAGTPLVAASTCPLVGKPTIAATVVVP